MKYRLHDPLDGSTALDLIVENIFHLWNAFHTNLKRCVGSVGLTYRQWMLMESAAAGLRTVPQLARRMGLPRQTIQRAADELVDRKMASFQRNPDHLRSPYLMINDRGLELLLAIEKGQSEQRREFAGVHELDKSDLEVAAKVLSKFRELVGPENKENFDPGPARSNRLPLSGSQSQDARLR